MVVLALAFVVAYMCSRGGASKTKRRERGHYVEADPERSGKLCGGEPWAPSESGGASHDPSGFLRYPGKNVSIGKISHPGRTLQNTTSKSQSPGHARRGPRGAQTMSSQNT